MCVPKEWRKEVSDDSQVYNIEEEIFLGCGERKIYDAKACSHVEGLDGPFSSRPFILYF